jgi:hypothetical protein
MTIEPENPIGVLWGAKQIGHFIGKNPRAAFHLLETGQLPGRKHGKLWTATKDELRAALTGENTTSQASGGR